MIHEVETGRGHSEITKPTSGQSPYHRLGESVISPRPWPPCGAPTRGIAVGEVHSGSPKRLLD